MNVIFEEFSEILNSLDKMTPSFMIISITSVSSPPGWSASGTAFPKTLFPISIPVVSPIVNTLDPTVTLAITTFFVISVNILKLPPTSVASLENVGIVVPNFVFGSYVISIFLLVLTSTYPFALPFVSPISPPPARTELSIKLNTLPFALSVKS